MVSSCLTYLLILVGYFKDRILFLTVSQSPNVEKLRTKIWGYIMGNERLDANYVVPQWQWMPQFECRSEARTLIVLDDIVAPTLYIPFKFLLSLFY